MSCNDCEDIKCACEVPECIDTLLLGRVDEADKIYYAYIEKMNGATWVQQVVSDGSGNVALDMTDPDKAFYNSFDGRYIIYLVDVAVYGYFYTCTDEPVTITAHTNNETYQKIAVTFKPFRGATQAYVVPEIE